MQSIFWIAFMTSQLETPSRLLLQNAYLFKPFWMASLAEKEREWNSMVTPYQKGMIAPGNRATRAAQEAVEVLQ